MIKIQILGFIPFVLIFAWSIWFEYKHEKDLSADATFNIGIFRVILIALAGFYLLYYNVV